MEQNKNTQMIWAIVIIVALIIIGALVMRSNRMDTVNPDNTNIVADAEVEGVEDTTDPVTGAPVTTGSGAVTLSYQKALVTYKDRRIQLDKACQATPNNVTYKNGTSIMIDNRSPEARTFKLGSTYTIKGYGFRIITLNSSTVPATWLLDCGAGQNAATILIQK